MSPSFASLKIYHLTPVEEYNRIFFKRDDKYMPFDDVPLNGGKVRQCCCLFLNNYDNIKKECNNLVATATSVNSPQGINVSRIAKEFNFESLIVFGATKEESLVKNPLFKWMREFGSKFDCECKIGYDAALVRRINQIKEKRNLFHVKFGINLEDDPNAIINSIAYQVQNLPKDLDNLIIPTGSGITAGGILVGLQRYKIKPKRTIVVQIAGYDRRKTLKRICDLSDMTAPDYDYVADKAHPYSKQLKIKPSDEFELDPVYEAKAYEWMMKQTEFRGQKTCFWVVGDSSYFRTYPYSRSSFHTLDEMLPKLAV